MKQRPTPTVEQLTEMFRICASLTDMLVSIQMIRVDERTGDLIILAGAEIQAAISKQGEVDYSD